MRLADIWERNTDMKVYNLEFPSKVDRKSKNFFIRELKDFTSILESWGGEITVDRVRESLSLYRELERKLSKLFEIKADYETVIRVQEVNVREALKIVDKKLKKVEKKKKGPKILITGSVCPFVDVYRLFEDVGFILKDDICTGTRFFAFNTPEREIKTMEDVYEYIADRYFNKAPCPTKHFSDDSRFQYVLDLAKDCDGVVFLLLKFCEPHFYDYPQLKERLEDMGKKTMLIELEFPLVSHEQLRTRIEAFYEVASCR